VHQDQSPASQRTKTASIKRINRLALLRKSWPSVMSNFKSTVEKDEDERNVKFMNRCPLQLLTMFWRQVYIIRRKNSSPNDAETPFIHITHPFYFATQ